MRKVLIFLVICSSILMPVSARAQAPTPPPTATPVPICPPDLQKTCDWGIAVTREYGIWVLLLGVLLAIIVWIFKRIQKVAETTAEGGLSKVWETAEKEDRSKDLTTRYLRKASVTYARFKFRGLPRHIAKNDANRLSLDQAYISVRVLSESEKPTTEKSGKHSEAGELVGHLEKSEPVVLTDVLKKNENRHLAIIGVAGSGKSTLLQWAGLACARSYLGERLKEDQEEFVKALGGGKILPIFISLRAYNEYCKQKKINRSARSLLEFMASHFSENQSDCEFAVEFFQEKLRGPCLLMFDGVDEVEKDDRAGVRTAIEHLLVDFEHPKLYCLITSRPTAAYISDQMHGFRQCEVQLLTPEQRENLIHFWHKAVFLDEPGEAGRRISQLIQRIDNAPRQVQELAVTPLMVTIFCMVSYSHDLPRLRAQLYEDAVEILLTETVHHEGDFYKGLEQWGGMGWGARCLRLSFIAFTMQNKKVLELPETDLVELIWGKFGVERESAQESARQFLRLIAERGGLLESVDEKYAFYTHATFQEYLSGRYLAQEMNARDQESFLAANFIDDRWRESVRLAAGYLSIRSQEPADRFVKLLAGLGNTPAERACALTLAGEALVDMMDESRVPQTVRAFTAVMKTSFISNPPTIEIPIRQRLGLALGELGDPRFSISMMNGTRVVLPEMIPILKSVFRMGTNEGDEKIIAEQGAQSWDDEKPSHLVSLSEYSIGKYPVTNAEFRCFWEQGGYDPKANWWSEDGRIWRTGAWDSDFSWLPNDDLKKQWKEWLTRRPLELRDRPFWWDDSKWNAENLPVVGITWFEMEAYCNWLSHVTSKPFRLPTEAEWEHAARGPENLIWSWGNGWDSEKANTDEAEKKLGNTSPAGMYPHGASPYGVEDMIGNVWEWCLDWYDENEYRNRRNGVQNPRGPKTGQARVLRGGSWDDLRNHARCSYRSWYGPDDFNINVGFRLVCSPSISEL